MLYAAFLDAIEGQARRLLRLRGADARRFLSGSVSGDLDALAPDRAVTAALLTVKGKLVSELVVLAGADSIDAWIPQDVFDAVARAFDDHIVMDDVVLEPVPDHAAAIIWDDEGDEVALPVGITVVHTRHPLPAQLAVGPAELLRSALAGAEPVDRVEFERARIESGTPGWGAELRPGFFPPEVGFVYAVSYTKGCYMGQEPLARLHARGQVHRVMARVVLERACAVGTQLAAEAREDAGTLTTCVGEVGGAAGLAIVRREFATPGGVLRTHGDAPVAVRVVSGPLGDDEGLRKS